MNDFDSKVSKTQEKTQKHSKALKKVRVYQTESNLSLEAHSHFPGISLQKRDKDRKSIQIIF